MDPISLEFVTTFFLLEEDEEAQDQPPKKKRKSPFIWERPWLSRRVDPACENVYTLMNLLRELEDTAEFRRMMRMDEATYDFLLSKVTPFIEKQDTFMRAAITPGHRLSVTMRYLAHGHNCPSLIHQFIVCKSSVHRIIDETVAAIVSALGEEFLSTPNSKEEWNDVAKLFRHRWNFPNCIGALDGKHIRIRKPNNSGSTFYNYKHFHSIVLMALVDANYEFLFVDVGQEGRQSDGGIWAHSSLMEGIEDGDADLPGPRNLPGSDVATEMVIVADDAFALSPHLVKPFGHRRLSQDERIFNYRLSRARRVAENAFGIMASRFRIFQTEIHASPDRVTNIVLAGCCLHNLLRRRCGKSYLIPGSIDSEDCDLNVVPGAWRKDVTLVGLESAKQKNTDAYSKAQRKRLKNYFLTSEGSVPWQDRAVQEY